MLYVLRHTWVIPSSDNQLRIREETVPSAALHRGVIPSRGAGTRRLSERLDSQADVLLAFEAVDGDEDACGGRDRVEGAGVAGSAGGGAGGEGRGGAGRLGRCPPCGDLGEGRRREMKVIDWVRVSLGWDTGCGNVLVGRTRRRRRRS
jgi:hypothetical protein